MKNSLKIIRRLNMLVSGGVSGLYFYNNKYFLEDNKNKVELKIDNVTAPIAPKIKHLVRNVMSDMALSTEEKSLIQVFITNDCNLKHLGYPDKNFGAFLGIPQHFVLEKTTDFVVIPTVDNNTLSSDSPEAWNFKSVLTLSKEAKKFAIANEIFEAKHVSFYYLGLLAPFVFLQANLISLFSEKLLKTFGRQVPIFHSVVFLLAVGFYILLNDYINIQREGEAVCLAGKLGPSYIEGGIEYYENVLGRNKAMLQLDKDAPYTVEGEVKKYMGFRISSMPFQRRIQMLRDLKRKYRFSENKENPLKSII